MTTTNRESLWELVDVADIAARVASHLRQMKAGRVSRDAKSIDRAIQFLTEAEEGGKFMSTGHLSSDTSTLRPLNWAMDIYQGIAGEQQTEYGKLADYLEEILFSLKKVKEDHSALEPEELEKPINFFSGLGRMLSSQIDQQRTTDSFEMRQ